MRISNEEAAAELMAVLGDRTVLGELPDFDVVHLGSWMHDQRYPVDRTLLLSGGERIIWELAHAMWRGTPMCIADVGSLPSMDRRQILKVLILWLEGDN